MLRRNVTNMAMSASWTLESMNVLLFMVLDLLTFLAVARLTCNVFVSGYYKMPSWFWWIVNYTEVYQIICVEVGCHKITAPTHHFWDVCWFCSVVCTGIRYSVFVNEGRFTASRPLVFTYYSHLTLLTSASHSVVSGHPSRGSMLLHPHPAEMVQPFSIQMLTLIFKNSFIRSRKSSSF